MNRTFRPVLYLMLGVAIYFVIDADDNPQLLDEFHQYAPFAILALFVMLLLIRRYNREHDDREDKK